MQDNINLFPGRSVTGSGKAPKYQPPTLFTSLIGREQDVTALCSLLQRPEVRLLTLLGAGGVGKTRLAIEVAHQTEGHLLDEVRFVGLAAVSDPYLLLPSIAEELGIGNLARNRSWKKSSSHCTRSASCFSLTTLNNSCPLPPCSKIFWSSALG